MFTFTPHTSVDQAEVVQCRDTAELLCLPFVRGWEEYVDFRYFAKDGYQNADGHYDSIMVLAIYVNSNRKETAGVVGFVDDWDRLHLPQWLAPEDIL